MGLFDRRQRDIENADSESREPMEIEDIQRQKPSVHEEKKLNLNAMIGAAENKRLQSTQVSDDAVHNAISMSSLANDGALEKSTEDLETYEEDARHEKPKTAKKRTSLGRTNQIKTRLTDSELSRFRKRVEKSGLPQGEFVRRAVLNNQIVIEECSVVDIAFLDELSLLRAELGRQGGLLKMIIKPNIGQCELSPKEWEELLQAIRGFEDLKRLFSELERKIANGNRQA